MKSTRFIPCLLQFEQYATDCAELNTYIKTELTVPRTLRLILSQKYDKIENSSLLGRRTKKKRKAFQRSEQGFHWKRSFRIRAPGEHWLLHAHVLPLVPVKNCSYILWKQSHEYSPAHIYLEKRYQVINRRKLTHFTTPLRAHGWLPLPAYLRPSRSALHTALRQR